MSDTSTIRNALGGHTERQGEGDRSALRSALNGIYYNTLDTLYNLPDPTPKAPTPPQTPTTATTPTTPTIQYTPQQAQTTSRVLATPQPQQTTTQPQQGNWFSQIVDNISQNIAGGQQTTAALPLPEPIEQGLGAGLGIGQSLLQGASAVMGGINTGFANILNPLDQSLTQAQYNLKGQELPSNYVPFTQQVADLAGNYNERVQEPIAGIGGKLLGAVGSQLFPTGDAGQPNFQLTRPSQDSQAQIDNTLQQWQKGNVAGAVDSALRSFQKYGNEQYDQMNPMDALVASFIFDPLNLLPGAGIGEAQKAEKLGLFTKAVPRIEEAADLLPKGLGAKIMTPLARVGEAVSTGFRNIALQTQFADNADDVFNTYRAAIKAGEDAKGFDEIIKQAAGMGTVPAQRASRYLQGFAPKVDEIENGFHTAQNVLNGTAQLSEKELKALPKSIQNFIKDAPAKNLTEADLLEAVKAEFLDATEKHMAKTGASLYPAKARNAPERIFSRLMNEIKGAEALLYIGLSPVTFMRNLINGVTTMAIEGVNPLMSVDRQVAKLKSLGQVEKAQHLRDAERLQKSLTNIGAQVRGAYGEGQFATAQTGAFGSFMSKMIHGSPVGKPLKWYQQMENSMRARVWMHTFDKTQSVNWVVGKHFQPLDSAGQAVMHQYGVDPNAIYNTVSEAGTNEKRIIKNVSEVLDGTRPPGVDYEALREIHNARTGDNMDARTFAAHMDAATKEQLASMNEERFARVMAGENKAVVENDIVAKAANEEADALAEKIGAQVEPEQRLRQIESRMAEIDNEQTALATGKKNSIPKVNRPKYDELEAELNALDDERITLQEGLGYSDEEILFGKQAQAPTAQPTESVSAATPEAIQEAGTIPMPPELKNYADEWASMDDAQREFAIGYQKAVAETLDNPFPVGADTYTSGAQAGLEEIPAPNAAPLPPEPAATFGDVTQLTTPQSFEEYIPVFRGTGDKGLKDIRPSSEGMLGEGVYFYTRPQDAAAYAGKGGGIITAYVKPEDAIIKGDTVLVKDPSKIIRRGTIPTDKTLNLKALDDVSKRALGVEYVQAQSMTFGDVAKAARAKGIATISDKGKPINKFLLNVLNKHAEENGVAKFANIADVQGRAEEALRVLDNYVGASLSPVGTPAPLQEAVTELKKLITPLEQSGMAISPNQGMLRVPPKQAAPTQFLAPIPDTPSKSGHAFSIMFESPDGKRSVNWHQYYKSSDIDFDKLIEFAEKRGDKVYLQEAPHRTGGAGISKKKTLIYDASPTAPRNAPPVATDVVAQAAPTNAPKEVRLPHFANSRKDLQGGKFVGFYMDDADLKKLKIAAKRAGGVQSSTSPFYMKWNGRSLDDIPKGEVRSESVDLATELSQKYSNAEFSGLTHMGYYIELGNDGKTFFLFKGKIKPNQHTRVEMLDTIPPSLKKAVQEYKQYVSEVQTLIDEQFAKGGGKVSNAPDAPLRGVNPDMQHGDAGSAIQRLRNIANEDENATKILSRDEMTKAEARAHADIYESILALWQSEEVKRLRLGTDAQNRINAWLRREVLPSAKDSRTASLVAADWMDNAVMINRDGETKFDAALSILSPFQFWRTRFALQSMRRVADKPARLLWYMKLRQMQDSVHDDPRFPKRLQGKLEFPIQGMPAWAGGSMFFDPLESLTNIEQVFGLNKFDDSVTDADIARAIRTLAKRGEIRAEDAANAIANQSGTLWDTTAQQMQNLSRSSEGVDNITDMFRPHLPLDILWKLQTGNADQIGVLFPMTRLVRGATSALAPKGSVLNPTGTGLNIEAPLKVGLRNLTGNQDIPDWDAWEQYRTDRALADMVGNGEISARDAMLALIERRGKYYDMAQQNAQFQSNAQTVGGILGANLFPTGEREYYKARVQRDSLLDQTVANLGANPQSLSNGEKWDLVKANGLTKRGTPLGDFFTKYPVMAARGDVYQEPEARLKSFLTDEMWQRYTSLSALDKRMARNGNKELAAFIANPDRNYDNLTIDQVAEYVKYLRGYTPESELTPKIGNIPQISYADPNQSARYQDILDKQKALFDMDALQPKLDAYGKLTPQGKRDYRAVNPDVDTYFRWYGQQMGANPDISKLIRPDTQAAYQSYYSQQQTNNQLTQAVTRELNNMVNRIGDNSRRRFNPGRNAMSPTGKMPTTPMKLSGKVQTALKQKRMNAGYFFPRDVYSELVALYRQYGSGQTFQQWLNSLLQGGQ